MESQDTYWQQDQAKVQLILDQGSACPPNVSTDNLFTASPKTLRCIDERVDGNVALGGCGILLGLDQSVELLKNAGLEAITSHQGCGAAGLYCQLQGIDQSQVDQTAINFAKNLAEKLGVPYTDHQPVSPASHVARVIYYVGAETFNPRALPQLPAGFVVSRYYHHDLQTALDEVSLSIDIAFGDHGFGERFASDYPLLIIAVPHLSSPAFGQDQLLAELNSLTRADLDRVRVLPWTTEI